MGAEGETETHREGLTEPERNLVGNTRNRVGGKREGKMEGKTDCHRLGLQRPGFRAHSSPYSEGGTSTNRWEGPGPV